MTASAFPEVMLRTSGSPLAVPFLDVAMEIQRSLFDVCGVPTPIIRQDRGEGVAPNMAELWLNGTMIESVGVGELSARVVALLQQHAADLLTSQLVEHYLAVLEAKHPVLIGAARKRIAAEILTGELRDRLRKGEPITDFAGILEELLAKDLAASLAQVAV